MEIEFLRGRGGEKKEKEKKRQKKQRFMQCVGER